MRARGSATVEDFRQVPGKAELVGGEIVHMMAAGALTGMRPERFSQAFECTRGGPAEVMRLETTSGLSSTCRTASRFVQTPLSTSAR